MTPKNSLSADIHVKMLCEPESVLEARSLLYEVYIEKLKWHFLSSNPSQLRVESYHGKKILMDRFIRESLWFGAFDGSKLVGCVRLCMPDERNKFEVEGYPSSAPIWRFLQSKKHYCFEATRAAVKTEYSCKGIMKRLFLALFQYCQDRKCSVFGCTANLEMISFFKKIAWPLVLPNAFKYEPHDPKAVHFYLAKYEKGEIKRIIENLYKTFLPNTPNEEKSLITPEHLRHSQKPFSHLLLGKSLMNNLKTNFSDFQLDDVSFLPSHNPKKLIPSRL